MENDMRQDQAKGRHMGWLVAGALALSAAAPVLLIAYLLVMALFALCMFRLKPGYLALLLLPMAVTAFLLYTPLAAAAMLVLGAGGAGILYALQKRRVSGAYTAAAVAALGVACLYAVVCMPGILDGSGAFSAVQAAVDETVELMRQMLIASAERMPGGEALAEAYTQTLQVVSASASEMVVPCLCGMGAVIGLSNFLFFRLFAAKRVPELAPLQRFSLWAIPKNMTTGILVLLLGTLALQFLDASYAQAVSSTVSVIFGFPLILQALASIDFFIQRRAKNKTSCRVVVYLLIAFAFPLVQSGLVLIGCAEQIFRFRERSADAPPPEFPDTP